MTPFPPLFYTSFPTCRVWFGGVVESIPMREEAVPLSPSLRLTYTVPGRQLQDSPGCFGLGCRALVYSGNILHDTVQSMFASLACWHRPLTDLPNGCPPAYWRPLLPAPRNAKYVMESSFEYDSSSFTPGFFFRGMALRTGSCIC
jgi:hypothetical protein